jgi:glutaredoxin
MKRTHDGHPGHRRLAAALLGLVLLVIAGAAAAQVYKWKDEHGVTHYGDTPPPRVKSDILKTDRPAPARAPVLPYELARAVQAAPVVLYTTARCDGCDQGRALLRARGIPFSERTVNSGEDQQQLERANGGRSELPLLLVGSRKVAGFQSTAWQDALTAAAYPRQKMLPPSYQFAAPVPAGAASGVALPASTTTTSAPPTPPVRGQIKMPPDEAAAQAADQQPRSRQSPAAGTPPTQ